MTLTGHGQPTDSRPPALANHW